MSTNQSFFLSESQNAPSPNWQLGSKTKVELNIFIFEFWAKTLIDNRINPKQEKVNRFFFQLLNIVNEFIELQIVIDFSMIRIVVCKMLFLHLKSE